MLAIAVGQFLIHL